MTNSAARRPRESGSRRPSQPELPPPDELEQLPLGAIDDDLVLLHWPVAIAPPLPPQLTCAERAVALLACEGLSGAAIAGRRRTSVKTVAKQLSSAYRKLGVGSRAGLVARLNGHRGA
ncbi:MAG TPA: helix-turn-helix transcriptional regulator [Anaeromyxobacteraceae bacterium]|nr:helix-turn-helix transcriptional regulator [Anaeromyxobacteraceae bacterium]